MTEKLTYEEVMAVFGASMPVAALSILQNADAGANPEELRQQLKGMGALWKSILGQNKISDGISPYFIFGMQGLVVIRIQDNRPLFVAQSEAQASEYALLLNLGHIEYVKRVQKERLESGVTGALGNEPYP